MWTEHVGAAKRDLNGSRLRDVMKAHALTVHRTLKGAMDDVERQFRDGMKPLLAAKLPGVDDTTIVALITSTIKSFRAGFDRPWAVAALEKQLQGSMQPEAQIIEEPPIVTRVASSITKDPVGYLLGLVLGSAIHPLAPRVRAFLASATASYLDPFLDGEVPAGEYLSRSSGTFMSRLEHTWASDPLCVGECPDIPAECALGQYAAHCVCKMNGNFGFGMHTPGLGRQPASDGETARYFEQLGKAVIAAIQRDFDEPDRKFGALPSLTAGHVIHVGKVHLSGLVLYQTELGNALAQVCVLPPSPPSISFHDHHLPAYPPSIPFHDPSMTVADLAPAFAQANREGEEARREERLRIWGYA